MFDEKPELYFEYVPAGSLLDYLPVTTSFHNQSIAVQVLSGVEYLHNLEVPTTHRDIKPENVLVQHWRSDSVCIKLADFGLSKQSDYLQTRCGTAIYAAPEILSGRYTPLVDIWSVGVLLVRLECGRLPGYRQGISPLAWAIALLSFVQEYLQGKASRLLSFVLQDMFVIQAEGRLSASKCHAKALEIFEEEMDGSANGSAVSSMELSETGEKWDEGGASSTEYANASPVGRKRRPDQEDNETRKRIKVW